MDKIKKIRPSDGILEFEGFRQFDGPASDPGMLLEKVVKFSALPIQGWYDQNEILDSKCRQHCVKDCSCVSHCSLIIA